MDKRTFENLQERYLKEKEEWSKLRVGMHGIYKVPSWGLDFDSEHVEIIGINVDDRELHVINFSSYSKDKQEYMTSIPEELYDNIHEYAQAYSPSDNFCDFYGIPKDKKHEFHSLVQSVNVGTKQAIDILIDHNWNAAKAMASIEKSSKH